jgi:hypothetical protein
VKTKAMADPAMPLIMRLLGRMGTTPELAARNAVRVLTKADAEDARGAVLRSSKTYAPVPLVVDQTRSARLWEITTELGDRLGVPLP